MLTALIDGDEIAYRAALKCQQKYWIVKRDDKLLYKHHERDECVSYIENDNNLELDSIIEDLGVEKGISALDNEISRILFKTNTSEYKIFLNGDKVFRYELATLLPYKGERDESKKPIHLEFFKDECRYRGATSVPYLEADDMLVVNYQLDKSNSIICSQDKDLRTVPSWNYNPNKGEVTFINERTAKRNFYYQLLIGDSTDNIPSPYMLGEVTANKILDRVKDSLNDREIYQLVKDNYSKYLSQGRTKWYLGQDVDSVLWEIGNLLYMHRTLDEYERWELPL